MDIKISIDEARRLKALELAHSDFPVGAPTEMVLARARLYVEFLSGENDSPKKQTKRAA